MDGSYSGKLQVWGGWTAAVHDLAAPPDLYPVRPFPAAESADALFAAEALRPVPRPVHAAPPAEPYSLQWFLDIETLRHGRQGRWIPRLLEFSKHAGETLVGLGCGLGTDWLQYARHGARVIVCGPSAHHLGLARRHFELRGLGGRFLHVRPTSLPLESASIDVVCVSNLPPEAHDLPAVVEEIYRVLKPGGKILAVTPARYDVDFWYHCCFPWQRWLSGAVVHDGGAVKFSGRGLRRLFGRFAEHRVYKRHLRRAEMPHMWRWLPPSLCQRFMGRLLVLKAFKPLSAAIASQLAA